jgi:hypothetical protein
VPPTENGCQACPPGRFCTRCRRAQIITAVTAAVPGLPAVVLAEAVDAVLTNPAITRHLAAALTADPAALLVGAPPVIGRLVGERGCHEVCVRAGWCMINILFDTLEGMERDADHNAGDSRPAGRSATGGCDVAVDDRFFDQRCKGVRDAA